MFSLGNSSPLFPSATLMLTACDALLQWQLLHKMLHRLLICRYFILMLHQDKNATLKTSQNVWHAEAANHKHKNSIYFGARESQKGQEMQKE